MALIKMNFLSKMLGMQTNVTIALPTFSFADIMNNRSDYYVQGMKYQVLWLLHGGSGDDSDYVNFSNIIRYADDNKLAVVMPADYNQQYTDDESGAQYFKYVVDELPQMLSALFPLSDKREDNFVGGLSMGAHGAMKCAILRPEKYSAALIMSGAARDPQKPMNPPFIFDAQTGLAGPKMIETIAGSDNDAYFHARKNVAEQRPLPEFYITCGLNDFALERAQSAADFLAEEGYTVHTEWVEGYSHEWDFWDLTLKKAISEWMPLRREIIYPK